MGSRFVRFVDSSLATGTGPRSRDPLSNPAADAPANRLLAQPTTRARPMTGLSFHDITRDSSKTHVPTHRRVASEGFEPPKHSAADLQSAPFGHSGNLPCPPRRRAVTAYKVGPPDSQSRSGLT